MEFTFYNSKINKSETINLHDIDDIVYQVRNNLIVELKITDVYISHCTNTYNSLGISTRIEYCVESETFGKERIEPTTVFDSVDDIVSEMKSNILK